jgi:peptide/nickel transport system substrate-binding protein
MAFSFRFASDAGIPFGPSSSKSFFNLIESAEATDDATFVMTYKSTYYRGDRLGLQSLWPLPRHILEPVYDTYLSTQDVQPVVNLPYWTSQYVNTGPFRVTAFDPASTITLQAYEGYFLGRPLLDTIHLKIFNTADTIFSNLHAGTVDIFLENTLPPNQGFQLMEEWTRDAKGTVTLLSGAIRLLDPQLRPAIQSEPAQLDPQVRGALYRAVDREALVEALQGGHRELAAFELLPSKNPFHYATKDSLRRYAFDPERAKAILTQAGWMPGADGKLVSTADGRVFRTSLTGTAGRDRSEETAIIADYWRRIGLEVEERTIPDAQVRNPAVRASFPHWEVTSGGDGDYFFQWLEQPPAMAENRWIGNRPGYDSPEADRLIRLYRSSLSVDAQADAIRQLSEVVAVDLPVLPIYYTAYHVGATARTRALEDVDGGGAFSADYGTFSRNAHLWSLR